MLNYEIVHLNGYPKNGKHQECLIDLPFEVTRGKDFGPYTNENDGRVIHDADIVDKRWEAVDMLGKDIFPGVYSGLVDANLEVLLKKLTKIYKKYLKAELARIKR